MNCAARQRCDEMKIRGIAAAEENASRDELPATGAMHDWRQRSCYRRPPEQGSDKIAVNNAFQRLNAVRHPENGFTGDLAQQFAAFFIHDFDYWLPRHLIV